MLTIYALGCWLRGVRNKMALHLSPPSEPQARRSTDAPETGWPMTSVTSREVPSGWKGLRLATTFPVPVVTSRRILITYTSLSTGIALFRKN
jgi:hypothetical protein